MFFRIWVQTLGINALEAHPYNIEYSTVQNFVKVDRLSRLLFNHVRGLFEAQLISFFEFSVVFVILLDCVVGKMDKWFFNTFFAERKLMRAHANIPLFKQIAFLILQVAGVN